MQTPLGPMGNAAFWNVIFRELGKPDVWTNGQTCTNEMAEFAGQCLVELLKKYSPKLDVYGFNSPAYWGF